MKTRSLSHLGLIRYRVVTVRQTDRIPIANTRSAVPVARKKSKNVLNGTKKLQKNKKQTGYGRNKKPEIEKLKRKEITITESGKKI